MRKGHFTKKVYVLLVNNKSPTSGALGYMDLLKKE